MGWAPMKILMMDSCNFSFYVHVNSIIHLFWKTRRSAGPPSLCRPCSSVRQEPSLAGRLAPRPPVQAPPSPAFSSRRGQFRRRSKPNMSTPSGEPLPPKATRWHCPQSPHQQADLRQSCRFKRNQDQQSARAEADSGAVDARVAASRKKAQSGQRLPPT